MGGRKTQYEETEGGPQRDFMLFRDTTVSRKHFEVNIFLFFFYFMLFRDTTVSRKHFEVLLFFTFFIIEFY